MSFHRLLKIECEFYKGIDIQQVSNELGIEQDIIDFIFRFWILKRKSLGNRPLLIPRSDSEVGTGETGVISAIDGNAEQDTEREKLKKFISLRQDLETVRNLCYMVSRREKLQKSFVKLREQIFEKQLDFVADDAKAQQMSLLEVSALLEANHGPTIYDNLFSHADAEKHTENDFEVIVSRISGEITEKSSQIRKDNPYRKISMPTSVDTKKSWAYKRIFSDTSASEEDVLNMSASMPKAGSRKKRSEGSSYATTSTITAEVAAANAAAMVGKKNSLGKKGNQRGSKQNNLSTVNKKKKQQATSKPIGIVHSDSSDISSAEDIKEQNIYRRKQRSHGAGTAPIPASRRLKSKIFSDTDSDAAVDSPSFRPKSPVFRTKAAMKDFGVENLPRGGSKKGSKSDRTKVTSPSPSRDNENSVKSRNEYEKISRKNKGYTKSSVNGEQLLKLNYISDGEDGSIPSSSEVDLSESDGERRIRRKKAQRNADLGHIMIVPERAAARKATAKLKVSQQDKSAVGEVQDQLTAGSGDASSVTSERRSKSKKSRDKELLTATDDSQASEDTSLRPDSFGLVPQRKAARKASAQIKVSDRGKEEGLLNQSSQLSPKKSPANISKGRKEKAGGILLPLSQRIAVHSGSDSDLEEPFPFRSPREKASRGRGTGGLNKSPRKRATHGSGRGRASGPASQPQTQQPVKKPLSSRAEALLSARASQLDVILGRTTSSVSDKPTSAASSVFQSPDKKLKTSEEKLENQDDGTHKQSLAGEIKTSITTTDISHQREIDRKKRREKRKAKALRRRNSRSSGTSSHSSSSSSSSSNVPSDNESRERTNDNADSKQGEHKNRVLTPRRGDFHNSPLGAGALTTADFSPAGGSPRSMPPTPEQISEQAGVPDKKKEDRYENRLFEAFKENQAPPPTPGRHLTHLIGGSRSLEEAEEENNEISEQRSGGERKYGVSPSISSPLISPHTSSQKAVSTDLKSPADRLFDQSPTRRLAQSKAANEKNNSTKDTSVICSPKSNEANVLTSKSNVLSNVRTGDHSERVLNDARKIGSQSEIIAAKNDSASSQGITELNKSVQGNFHANSKQMAGGNLPSGKVVDTQIDGTNKRVLVKQSKQSDEGYGTDAKVSPTEQAGANALLPPKESPSLRTVPETTMNQSQEHLNSNSQYDLGQLMRNQQQRQQQQLELNRIQQKKQELEKQKVQQQQQQQQQKQQYSQQRELEQSQWQQQLGQHMQGQNAQEMESMQNQNEALLNFIYKASMQQYPHGNNPQNAYNSLTPQQLQQMRDYGLYNNELFAYYQQFLPTNQQSSTYNNFLQQQMGQFPNATGAGYNKKDLQAFEQLMMQYGHQSQWQSMNKMSQQQQARNVKQQHDTSAHNQHKYPEDQEKMFQLLQQQHQQRQHHNHQTASAASSSSTISSSHSPHYHQAGHKGTSSLLPSAEDLQQLSSSSLEKVQNTSPLMSASATTSASSSMMQSHTSQKPRGTRDSPRQYPTQSPRGGGGSHIQQGGPSSSITSPSAANHSHHDIPSENAQSAVPSATPAEKLPGYIGGKKSVNDRHNSSSSFGAKMSQQDTDSSSSIPKELLESVAAIAKQPVWKPSSERSGGDMSPTKGFTGMTPDAKKLGSSPTKSPRNEKPVENKHLLGTTPHSDRSVLGSQHEQSDFDKSDYDDTKGGVDFDDYDDFDEDDWTKTTPQSSKPRRGRQKGTSGGRGRGRGNKAKLSAAEPILYTTHTIKSNTSIIERLTKANRGKQKQKHLNIDKRALEQVHKTVAGTDYDFEDEFGDEFGDEKPTNQSDQFSLQVKQFFVS